MRLVAAPDATTLRGLRLPVTAVTGSADPRTDPAGGSTAEAPEVVVAVLTYRRPRDLVEVLPPLLDQAGRLGRPARVLVVDNDPGASAAALVAAHAGAGYVHEPVPGIAAARNRALDHAAGIGARLLVFIDDDERPAPGWLRALVGTWEATGAGAVVGPVVSRFDVEPSPWVAAGRFFERRRPATGTPLAVAATNNIALDLAVLQARGLRFDERFGLSGGSDTLFSRQLHASGATMVWCDEALVLDVVPAARTTARWVLARALRSGNSWARTSLVLAAARERPGLALAVAQAGLLVRGGARSLGGAARLVLGVVLAAGPAGSTDATALQARGARTLARGLGMLGGAAGWTYREYRRPPLRRS